jgi:hypothetical protein
MWLIPVPHNCHRKAIDRQILRQSVHPRIFVSSISSVQCLMLCSQLIWEGNVPPVKCELWHRISSLRIANSPLLNSWCKVAVLSWSYSGWKDREKKIRLDIGLIRCGALRAILNTLYGVLDKYMDFLHHKSVYIFFTGK